MRKCCCCISVHVGSILLGVIAVLLALLELAVLIPYFLDIDVEEFNPIKENQKNVEYLLEDLLRDQNVTK